MMYHINATNLAFNLWYKDASATVGISVYG